MEGVKWSEQEQRTYAELFSVCDVENTGKISGVKAAELFLTSGLTQEVLHQITEICGAKRLGHFGRSQFYIALKLIAAVQSGLPVSFETLHKGYDIPVARFGAQLEHPADYYGDRAHGAHGHLPPGGVMPPSKQGWPGPLPTRSVYEQHTAAYEGESPQEPRSPPFSPNDSPPLSPPNESQRLDGHQGGGGVPGHGYAPMGFPNNNHVSHPHGMEKDWASFEDDSQGLISGEENKQHHWAHFSDHNDMRGDTSSISSEAESVDDVWAITEEQREYYTKQFQSMQPDVTGVILGTEAKEFFEKSRLPTHELAKIWQLSDVNRDGALSLDEFCIAMHLVVLRRNDIDLPENLPPALVPYVPLVNVNPDEPFAADLPPGSMKSLSPTSPQPTQWPPASFPPESPDSSAVSSPNAKPAPVNFEFQPVAADPDSKIIHPVPLRVSPDGHPRPVDVEIQKPRAYSGLRLECRGYSPEIAMISRPKSLDGQIPYLGGLTLKLPAESPLVESEESESAVMPPCTVVSGRPRPFPHKAGGLGRRASQPVDHQGQGRLLPPPAKPPDPDAALGTKSVMMPPPAVPPRPSPKEGPLTHNKKLVAQASEPTYIDGHSANFADFSQFQSNAKEVPPSDGLPATRSDTGEGKKAKANIVNHTHSDTQLPSSREVSGSKDNLDKDEVDNRLLKGKALPKQESQDKKELAERVRKQRERNLTLSRLNNELNQELQEVMEQRIALEIQLEHLRPFSS